MLKNQHLYSLYKMVIVAECAYTAPLQLAMFGIEIISDPDF